MSAVEVQSLCYILNNQSLKGFKGDWFTDYKPHFDYISDFYKKYGKVPDKVTFIDKFNDFKIFQVDDPISSLVERLKEQARYKRIIPIYNKAYELITANKSDEACKLLVEKISDMDKVLSSELPPVNLSDPEVKKQLYKEHISGVTKFPTGRPEFDNHFGGWNSKDYVVIFARLGIGKSWISEYFAYNLVKNGLRVGYYSGEMSALEISLRVDTFNTHKSNNRMFNGNLEEADYSEVADSFSKLPGELYVITPEEIGDVASVETLRRFIENYKLQALFIDQISLMKRNPKLTAVEATKLIANDLRVLQATTGVPFFIVSQQSRQGTQDKEAKTKDELMATISLADELGQNATLAFYIDYNKDNKVLTLNLCKGRRCSPEKFHYSWDIDKGDIKYIPAEEVEDEADNTESPENDMYGDFGENPF